MRDSLAALDPVNDGVIVARCAVAVVSAFRLVLTLANVNIAVAANLSDVAGSLVVHLALSLAVVFC